MRLRATLSIGFALLAGRLAHADCAADFAADNTVKPGAGAFRAISVVQTTTEMDGKPYPMAAGKTWLEVAPPASLHLRNEMPFDKSEVVLVDGKQGWRRDEGDWSPLGADDVRILATDPDMRRYFSATAVRDLACLGEGSEEGHAVRTYRFTIGEPTLPIQVAAHFDAKTGLPRGGATDNRIGKTQLHAVITFEFDPTIKIAKP